MVNLIKPALLLLLTLAAITGILYPLVITGIAKITFPNQANGSLVVQDGRVVGSTLIGQEFSAPEYFWGRLSATAGNAYNASASGGSNLSVLNPALKTQVAERLAALKAADPENDLPVPVDLITASASGLDPDISLAAAEYQAGRVARWRGLDVERVQTLIRQSTHGRILGFLGEKTINVLEINLALDEIK